VHQVGAVARGEVAEPLVEVAHAAVVQQLQAVGAGLAFVADDLLDLGLGPGGLARHPDLAGARRRVPLHRVPEQVHDDEQRVLDVVLVVDLDAGAVEVASERRRDVGDHHGDAPGLLDAALDQVVDLAQARVAGPGRAHGAGRRTLACAMSCSTCMTVYAVTSASRRVTLGVGGVVERALDGAHRLGDQLLLLGQLGGVDDAVGQRRREVLELLDVGVEVRVGVVVEPAGAGHGAVLRAGCRGRCRDGRGAVSRAPRGSA
jgi:hypothetical protein